MRPRRSDRGVPAARRLATRAVLAASATWALVPRLALAQSTSGALFLQLPIAARIVGVGAASVADAPGSEGVESNPSSLGWLTRREGALHYGQDFRGTHFLAAAVLPSRILGTFALSWGRTAYGEEEATQGADVPATGTLDPHEDVFAASYGALLGKRLAVGVTFKVIRSDYFACSGICTPIDDPGATLPGATTTGAVDAGVQYDFATRTPLRVGVALRHAGLPVQVQDREQADPLPTEASVGARVGIPAIGRSVPGTELHLLGEVVTGVSSGTTGELRVGAEGTYRNAFALRAGYRYRSGEGSGPSVGFGYAAKRFAFDLATQFSQFATNAGQTPTFVAFRYWF